MNGQMCMRSRVYLIFAVLVFFMASCTTSKFPSNDEGVIQAQQATIAKDAIRIKGKVLSREKVGERFSYRIQVMEIIDYGSTFARVEPEVSEVVILYTTQEVKFKKNTELVFDALSPITKSGEVLELNMVNE